MCGGNGGGFALLRIMSRKRLSRSVELCMAATSATLCSSSFAIESRAEAASEDISGTTEPTIDPRELLGRSRFGYTVESLYHVKI